MKREVDWDDGLLDSQLRQVDGLLDEVEIQEKLIPAPQYLMSDEKDGVLKPR